MTAYSNKFPTDISPLNPNGFTFAVDRLPDTTFFVQSVNLPGINLGEFNQATPLVANPIPGEIITYHLCNMIIDICITFICNTFTQINQMPFMRVRGE